MFIINLVDIDYVKSQIQSFISRDMFWLLFVSKLPVAYLYTFFIEEKNVGYDEILGLPPTHGEWLICSKVYAIMENLK